MKLTIVELTAERDALVQANTFRKSGKGYLIFAGDYRLLRFRNYGHSSATALLQILQTKGHKDLVKSERRGGAAHYVQGRRLAAQAFAASASWSVIVIRTDAFSSSAARTDAHKL